MTLFSKDLTELSRTTLEECKAAGKRITTAESCTGGLVAAVLTEIAGSSDVVGRCFVTYSNEAKHEMLGVPTETLASHGAVSRETVRAMAEGALAAAGCDADLAVSVSGVAGPGGGSPEKPVGTVWMAVASRGAETATRLCRFPGDRSQVRIRTVEAALAMLRERLSGTV